MKQNLRKIMNGDDYNAISTHQIVMDKMDDMLSQYNEFNDGADLYATILVESIVDMRKLIKRSMEGYEEVVYDTDEETGQISSRIVEVPGAIPHKEMKVYLEYVRDLESVLAVRSRNGYKNVPAQNVSYEDDL